MTPLDHFLNAGTIVLWIAIAAVGLFVLWVVDCLALYGFTSVACHFKRKSRKKKIEERLNTMKRSEAQK